jgi:hypothetical protein
MENREITIRSDGDQIERDNWEVLKPYIHRYEIVWRLLVKPLRSSGSIYLRDGIDGTFEEFAMCHYTTYVNLARALEKIDRCADDFKFAEEIWANMHRAAEVAIKAVAAFRAIYKDCIMPRRNPSVNTGQLEKMEGSLKKYRNTLHDPMIGTAKEHGVRLLPRRELLQKYHRWTSIMYRRQPEDFASANSLLRSDFAALCSTLQNVWKEIETAIGDLRENETFVKRRSAGVSTTTGSTANPNAASGTFVLPPGQG